MQVRMVDTEDLLRRVLARNPRATVEEIRGTHPVFQTMSHDHLSLRLTQLLDRTQCSLAK